MQLPEVNNNEYQALSVLEQREYLVQRSLSSTLPLVRLVMIIQLIIIAISICVMGWTYIKLKQAERYMAAPLYDIPTAPPANVIN